MNIGKRLKIHPLILPAVVWFLVRGKLGVFLFLLLFVTIHEMSHCIMAVLLGAKLKQILITPIGERAILNHLERLSLGKRLAIHIAGPVVSLMLGWACFLLAKEHSMRMEYALMNWVIGGFNLLPFFPMDGGDILWNLLGKRYGTLKIAGALTKVSRGFGFFLVALGLVQVILYPFNISLMVIGCYFSSVNRREYLYITYHTYKEFLAEKTRNMPIRGMLVAEEAKLGDLVQRINLDDYYIFYRKKDGKLEKKNQDEVMKALMERGALGKVWET